MNDLEVEAQRVRALAERAKKAARKLAPLGARDKDAALTELARSLDAEAALGTESEVLRANAVDCAEAEARGIDRAMLDRLRLDAKGLGSMANAVREIAAEKDPVGLISDMVRRPNGLLVGRVTAPLGVIAMVYEARPNVTTDATALAIKSGNAVLLRGGKEARHSNVALGKLVSAALEKTGLPADAMLVIEPAGHDQIRALVSLQGLIDLAIPRGGEALIRFVTEHAKVPVIQHYKGVCHLYVDEGADLDMAESLVEDSKLAKVSACNALECLLVHASEAERFLPRLQRLIDSRGLEVRGDKRTVALVPGAKPATDADWGTEFLAKVLAVRVVESFNAALDHIAEYGTTHTESICTRDYARGRRFLAEVDASCVLINASTRFNDGGELGLGAEMGISTSKLHAFGPMGLEHLTTKKWIVYGDGQTRV